MCTKNYNSWMIFDTVFRKQNVDVFETQCSFQKVRTLFDSIVQNCESEYYVFCVTLHFVRPNYYNLRTDEQKELSLSLMQC